MPITLNKVIIPFLFMMLMASINPNIVRVTQIASVVDQAIKKIYCEHPAISVTILFSEGGKPAFFPNNLTAITKRIATIISYANTALSSLLLKSFRNGIIAKEKPGGNSW